MKFTQQWLADHITLDLTPEAIGDKLTMAGLELEGLTRLGAGLEKVEVGVLLKVDPHPNADRLTRCTVSVGETQLSIVCGATNHKTGDKVAVARIGAHLPDGLKIKKGKIRGELSEGMLCSLAELGLADEAKGILILPAEAEPGTAVADLLGRTGVLFELDLTPNRGDCLGVRGIARELGALTQTPLRPLTPSVTVSDPSQAAIQIEDGEGCPRYGGRILRNVTVRPSPPWLQARLESVGLRPINNVVDVTNYILMDLNHPLHAFDLAKLTLPIVVRRAREGETLTTLDDIPRTLTKEMTVIADQNGPLALAGIMGGLESGVTEQTRDIFLEAAYFDPLRTARTGRQLAILSDSRYRFERGVDPLGLEQALDRATEWILATSGGTAGPLTLVEAGTWSAPDPIPFRPERVRQRGGIDLDDASMEEMLQRLGCHKEIDGRYRPPSHRHDLRQEEDLLEEVVRLYGYDRVPASLPRLEVAVPACDLEQTTSRRVRTLMTGLGYYEAITYAFVSPTLQGQFDPDIPATALLNPISEEQGVLRTTLIGGLMETARRNLSRGNLQLKLFEIGRVFRPGANGILWEESRVAGLLCGPAVSRHWQSPERPTDFFDMKGDLEALVSGLTGDSLHFEAGGPPFLHPGRKATISLGKKKRLLGWIGELHPSLQESLDPPTAIFLFELDNGGLFQPPAQPSARKDHPPLSRYPAVARDFAFLVDAAVPAQRFLETILAVDQTLIRTVTLFDLYTGEQVEVGKKSLALQVVFQAADRTLTEADTQKLADQIVQQVSETFRALQR